MKYTIVSISELRTGDIIFSDDSLWTVLEITEASSFIARRALRVESKDKKDFWVYNCTDQIKKVIT